MLRLYTKSSGIPVDLIAEERLDINRFDLLNLYLLSVLCKGVVLRKDYLRHFPSIDYSIDSQFVFSENKVFCHIEVMRYSSI